MSGTTVCLLRSTDTGAPVLSGTAGALTALLDACLQDGYNSKTIQSITRSGAVATVTYATGHGYASDNLTKVQISGCDQAEYNGIQQITYVSTTVFTFAVAGTPASGSGTMVSKTALLGWSKTYTGTNKGVYRGNESTGTRLYLRVDDANANSARAIGYEAMTDVDTGTGLFPTTAQLSGGLYINKSEAASASARPWVLVGDGYEFHLFTAYHGSTYANIYQQFHFGDPASELASDPFGCLIYGAYGVISTYPNTNDTVHMIANSSQQGHYFARLYTQIGTAVAALKIGNNIFIANNAGGEPTIGYGTLTYPSPANNGLYIAPLFVTDGTVLRGQLKAIYQPLHTRPIGNLVLVPANVSPINRSLLSIATPGWSSVTGETHIDIEGPWR